MSDGRHDGAREASPWEWALAAVSAVLVLGSIGFLLHQAITERAAAPRIDVLPDTIIAFEGGHLVEFRARNAGGRTAAGVSIEGVLVSGTGVVERARAMIDYIPAGGMRRGGLFFSRDPQRYRLELAPAGYARP